MGLKLICSGSQSVSAAILRLLSIFDTLQRGLWRGIRWILREQQAKLLISEEVAVQQSAGQNRHVSSAAGANPRDRGTAQVAGPSAAPFSTPAAAPQYSVLTSLTWYPPAALRCSGAPPLWPSLGPPFKVIPGRGGAEQCLGFKIISIKIV